MPVYKTEAIVIRRANLGESDRLLTLLTRDHGRLTAVAKGARKPKSRFAGRLELFSHVRVLLAVGRTLDVVSQVEVVDAFAELRADLQRMAHASLAAEVADRATGDRQPVPEVFAVLRQALQLIRGGDPEAAWLWFASRVLAELGYAPVVGRCVVCRRPVRGAALSLALGGTLCPADRERDPAAPAVSAPVLAALGFLLQARPEALERLSLPPGQRAELAGLLVRYLEYRLEVRLKSPAVVARLAGR